MIRDIAADPKKGMVEFRVRSSWRGQTRSETRVDGYTIGGQRVPRSFKIAIDEPYRNEVVYVAGKAMWEAGDGLLVWYTLATQDSDLVRDQLRRRRGAYALAPTGIDARRLTRRASLGHEIPPGAVRPPPRIRTMSSPRVTITEAGRAGLVVYRATDGELRFHWELGGDDALAVVHVGAASDWRARYPWAAERRQEILRFVADEVIRQKTPGCVAEIDDARGWITLRGDAAAGRGGSAAATSAGREDDPARRPGSAATTRARVGHDDVGWYHRLRGLQLKLALAVGALALLLALLVAVENTIFSIDPGKGTPIGRSVRTDTHVATLIQTLEAYVPSLARDHAKDTYAVGLFLVPLDGSAPRLVPIGGGHSGNSLGLVQILGSDGRTLWFDVNGVGGVDLATDELVKGAPANLRELQGARPRAFAPRVESHLATGFFTGRGTWLGLLSDAERAREYAPGQWLRRVTHAASSKEMRRWYRGIVGEGSGTGSRQIVAMEPIGDAQYLDAAFLRIDEASEPIRVRDPDGALTVHTSAPGGKGTVVLARVDDDGNVLWSADTQLDRFGLQQILPGAGSTALVGTRVPVPGKVSEPLLVLVDHATGEVTTHSLWR